MELCRRPLANRSSRAHILVNLLFTSLDILSFTPLFRMKNLGSILLLLAASTSLVASFPAEKDVAPRAVKAPTVAGKLDRTMRDQHQTTNAASDLISSLEAQAAAATPAAEATPTEAAAEATPPAAEAKKKTKAAKAKGKGKDKGAVVIANATEIAVNGTDIALNGTEAAAANGTLADGGKGKKKKTKAKDAGKKQAKGGAAGSVADQINAVIAQVRRCPILNAPLALFPPLAASSGTALTPSPTRSSRSSRPPRRRRRRRTSRC